MKFSELELQRELLKILTENPELACEEYRTKELKTYDSETSIQYQISEKYGPGTHNLIPNLKGIGIGRAKTTKTKIGVRHCTHEEFKNNQLKVSDIDLSQSMQRLEPFITNSQTKLEATNG